MSHEQRASPAVPSIDELMGEDGLYQRILEYEAQVDWKIARKQTLIADAAFKAPKVARTLRVRVSHRCENQAGLGRATDAEVPPGWTLRVEGRLEVPGKVVRTHVKPFSHFIKSLVVQTGDSDEVMEWTKGPGMAEREFIEFKRTGTQDAPVKIVLQWDHQSPKYRLSPELIAVVGELGEVTMPRVVLAIWAYIKQNQLQESEEKKVVNNDAKLQRLFGGEKIKFSDIPSGLRAHLLPIPPVELNYLVSVGRTEGSAEWPFEVEIDDPSRSRQTSAQLYPYQVSINAADKRVNELKALLKASAAHERNLRMFAADPVEMMRRQMEAYCADQQVALGEPNLTIADLMNPGSFDNDDVERAISIFASSRLRSMNS